MLYYKLPINQKLTKKQQEIINNKTPINQLNLEDLKEIYYFIDSLDGVLSATKISSVNNYYRLFGNLNNFKSFKEELSPAMALGTHIHKAIETKAESIKELYIYPEHLLEGATEYEKTVIKDKASGTNPVIAYINKYKTGISSVTLLTTPQTEWINIKYYKEIENKVNQLIKKYDSFLSTFKLLSNKDFMFVSKQEYDTIVDCYNAVINHSEAYDLLIKDKSETDNIETYSELAILYDLNDLIEHINFEFVKHLQIDKNNIKNCTLKSMFDRVIINHTKKIVTLVDIKTFNKAGIDFKESYVYWAYYRQMSLYYFALRMFLFKQDEKYYDYKFEVKIVPISTKYKNIRYIETINYYDLRNSVFGFSVPYNSDYDIYKYSGTICYSNLSSNVSKYAYDNLFKSNQEIDSFIIPGWFPIIQYYLNNTKNDKIN